MISLLPRRFHFYIFSFAVFLLAIGLPLSKYLMSLSQLILLGNWILEGDLKNKFIRFWENKPAFVLSSLLLMHFVGLFYTSDFQYAINDIRIKLPILALPLIISTSAPLSKRTTEFLLAAFIAATFLATVYSLYLLNGGSGHDLLDIRTISVFISHIRFGLLIAIAILILFSWIATSGSIGSRVGYALLICYFLVFMVMMQAMTGLIALFFAAAVMIVVKVISSQKKWLLYGGSVLLFVLLYSGVRMVMTIQEENVPKEQLMKVKPIEYTKRGNLYGFLIDNYQTENGYYIWRYFNMNELEEVWEKRSTIPFIGLDKKGNEIRFTIVRYLTSKGSRKDGDALAALSNDEINCIENGISNANYKNVSSIKRRIHELLWEIKEYRETGDPNGHSLTMRFEFWKTALEIIRANPLIGVGTGDVQQAFDRQYEADHSPLALEYRFHSHNQYLTMAVSFGLLGLAYFMVVLIYPVRKTGKWKDLLYISFFVVAVISFLNEDTLETQDGVTFYVFFNTLLLLGNLDGKKISEDRPQGPSLLFNRWNRS